MEQHEKQWFNNLREDDWEFVLVPTLFFGKSENNGSLYFGIGMYWLFWGFHFSWFLRKLPSHDWAPLKHTETDTLSDNMKMNFDIDFDKI